MLSFPIPRNKIEPSNMGKQALVMLQEKKYCVHLALYSQTTRISFTQISKSEPPPSRPIQTPDNSCNISTLDSCIMSDSVADAEIRWKLKNVLSCFSFRSYDGLSSLCWEVFSTERKMCILPQVRNSSTFAIHSCWWGTKVWILFCIFWWKPEFSHSNGMNGLRSELLGWRSESSLCAVFGFYFCWSFL